MLLDIAIPEHKKESIAKTFSREKSNVPAIQTNSYKGKAFLLIIRDLERLNWLINYLKDPVEITPPKFYDKNIIQESMSVKRNEILSANRKWIDKHIDLARADLANGADVLKSRIEPIIEVCKTPKQHDLFRILRYYWSSPYSEYVGRRIKLIIRDSAIPNNPIIGIAALGSPIIHIPERDNYIGWDKETRTQNINYMMDAYVIGALPPYNYILGGKLISYILTSNEIRNIFTKKYNTTKYDQLAGFFTTSLYGRSSQYNRLNFKNRLLYLPIGETKGFGTLHLTNETFNALNDFLKEQGIIVSNRFGSGPSWSMRVIRHAGELLGFNSNNLLTHSFKRNIYFVPFAENSVRFLNGYDKKLKYYKQNINTVTKYWMSRWYQQRIKNDKIIDEVKRFKRDTFEI